MSEILGLHHVTAIASDPQRNLNFYVGMLGLRFVKRTVNFDDPGTYHFYFGDEVGTPGSIMTFFPWPHAQRGRIGSGQVAVTSFAIQPAAIGFWVQRLIQYGVAYEGPTRRGSGAAAEQVLAFKDPDGLLLELVGHPAAAKRPTWTGSGIAAENAIHGFHGVTLWVERAEESARVLRDVMGFREVSEEETTKRYAAGDAAPGTFVSLREIGGFGRGELGAGTVHHVAFAVQDDAAELAMREKVAKGGLHPTPVVDRNYFHSVYFREPGGVLYELATLNPGFAIDEPVEKLGEKLTLPPQYEPMRADIERALPRIEPPNVRVG